MEAEIRSEELFQRTMMNYMGPVADIPELTEQLYVYCDALVGLSEMYESPIVLYNMYLVWVYRYEMLHDYEAMLEVCSRAEHYIEDNPNYLQEDKVVTFHLKKMSAYLHLRDFKNGRTNAEKSLQIFAEGSEVWYRFMEYYLLLAFHRDNHINALAIFNRPRSNTSFKKLENETKEKWKIYEVYLAYFIESQAEENPDLKVQSKKTFRVNRFLNEPVSQPRDLGVLSVHNLVAQVLFLLDMKNLPEATERIERLRSFANKQLDRTENFRMIQFIRLLQQLAKAEFQINELSNTDKYYDRLVEHPFFYRGVIDELEIVPFEKLWNHILSKLQS